MLLLRLSVLFHGLTGVAIAFSSSFTPSNGKQGLQKIDFDKSDLVEVESVLHEIQNTNDYDPEKLAQRLAAAVPELNLLDTAEESNVGEIVEEPANESSFEDSTNKASFFSNVKTAIIDLVNSLDDEKIKELKFYSSGPVLSTEDPAAFRGQLMKLDDSVRVAAFWKKQDADTKFFVVQDILQWNDKADLRDDFLLKFGSEQDSLRGKIHGKWTRLGTYVPGMVAIEPQTTDEISVTMCRDDPDRAVTLVVSGESGSGKTAFVKNVYRQKKKVVQVYYAVTSDDAKAFEKQVASFAKLPDGLVEAIRGAFAVLCEQLGDARSGHRKLYKAVSRFHFALHYDRNRAATAFVENKLYNLAAGDKDLEKWLDGDGKPFDQLVLSFDEVGKNIELARGLVDCCRSLHTMFVVTGRCLGMKLVLVGTGLQDAIDSDSEHSGGGRMCLGSDPLKSQVIVMMGPHGNPETLKSDIVQYLAKDYSFKEDLATAIVKGVFSKVLASNSRMLFDGVIPVLLGEDLTVGLDGEARAKRLRDLCCDILVMDYALRNYILLNRIGAEEVKERKKLLDDAFALLLQRSYETVADSNRYAYDKATKDMLALSEEKVARLKLIGIVDSRPLKTSAALKFLACAGDVVDLIVSDGLSFEALVFAHMQSLLRICGFAVDSHDLLEGWPRPASSGMKTMEDVKAEFRKNFFKMHTLVDVDGVIEKLQKLLNQAAKVAIVIRQTYPRAQGPDMFVVKGEKNGNKVLLTFDLLQLKHFKDRRQYPMVKLDSKKYANFVRTLGIRTDYEPLHCSAHYSHLGISLLRDAIKKKLEPVFDSVTTTVGQRVVAGSNPLSDTPWTEGCFKKAHSHGVSLWTRENLEPTISAADSVPRLPATEAGEHFSAEPNPAVQELLDQLLE